MRSLASSKPAQEHLPKAIAMLGGDFNALLLPTRRGYSENSLTREYDLQLRRFFEADIMGAGWTAGETPRGQHSYHTCDGSQSALID